MNNYDSSSAGHYVVNNVGYNSKISAILAAEKINSDIKFDFYDSIYSKFDWTTEPAETLEQLYCRRALELRAEYDYLVLHFSGGSDSNNILDTFIKNRIPLDEVLIRGPMASVDTNDNNTTAGNMYAEILFNAYPIANYVKNTYMPNLKIRVVDHSEYVIDIYSDMKKTENGFNPDTIGMGAIGPNLAAGRDYDRWIPEYAGIAERGKRIGHIFGTEKPNMFVDHGEFKLHFLDKALQHIHTNRATDIDLPVYKESFYCAASTASVIIKQAHAIKNYFKNNNLDSTRLNTAIRNRAYHDFIAKIIYPPRICPLLFTTEKVMGNVVIMPWERYFIKDVNAAHYINWKNNIDQLDKIVPDKYKHPDTDFLSLQGIFSKSYGIGF